MKILMVCLGNICRSPMAEGIAKSKALKRGLDIIFDSAGTSDYHVDQKPDARAIKKCAEYDIDISPLRGRQLTKEDFKKFDRILVMDSSNYENTIQLTSDPKEKGKVELILNMSNPNSNMSVPDPYFGDDDGFENVYQLLDAACDTLMKEVEESNR